MAPRGKIKSKVVRATIENKDVLDMFQNVLGTGNGVVKIEIVYPKYRALFENSQRFLRLLHAMQASQVMRKTPFECQALATYICGLEQQFQEDFSAPDLGALHPATLEDRAHDRPIDYKAITQEEYVTFVEVYNRLKNCGFINVVLVICNTLANHKKSLENKDQLKDHFLTTGAGTIFAPLPNLPSLNFKTLYIRDTLTPGDRAFLLMCLHKMYSISHDIYETLSSPDIDVDDFVEIIMSSIGDIRKHIPRCDEAFNKILESVHLLKDNFGEYYRDYVGSNNSTIIMENFVLDVSKNSDSSPKVTAQFRKIISHYKKLASERSQDPKLRTLFNQVDKNFQELARKTKDESDDEEEPEPESPEPDPGEVSREDKQRKQKREKKKRQTNRKRQVKAAAELDHLMSNDGLRMDDLVTGDSRTDDSSTGDSRTEDSSTDDSKTEVEDGGLAEEFSRG